MSGSQIMGTREAANALGVTQRTVLRFIEQGTLPALKLPGYKGAFVLDAADIDQLRQERSA